MLKRSLHIFVFIVILFSGLLSATYRTIDQIEDPDAYTLEGYCIVNTVEQVILGLNRFNTEKEFLEKCNGKMIFAFEEHMCTIFNSYNMRFPVLLSDFNGTYYFDLNSSKKVCGKSITEEVVKQIKVKSFQ